MNDRISKFLTDHKMTIEPSAPQIEEFLRQAGMSLEKEGAGSLYMLPAYVKTEGELPAGKPVIVIDAGGTNLRIALVHYNNDGECITDSIDKYPMLGTRGKLSVDEFFTQLAGYLKPYADKSDTIGFVFSFPCDIMPDLDGRIKHFNKEVEIPDAGGHYLGKELNKALNDMGCKGSWKVVILNDTVSTLMGGLGDGRKKGCNNYIGLILGTGLNIAYSQPCNKILKNPDLASMEGSVCINMEAGRFDGFARGEFDIAVDKASLSPGEMLFEKMCSGAYQGSVILEMLKGAAKDGLFCESTAKSILGIEKLMAIDADAFCRDKNGDNILASCVEEADKDTVYELLDFYYERVASMITSALTAVMILSSKGRGDGIKTSITADGSTFYKTLLFQPKLYKKMEEVAKNQYGLDYIFTKAEDGNISGACAAALLGPARK